VSYLQYVHLLRPTQPGHPNDGRHNEYWRWPWPLIGKNSEFCVIVSPVTRAASILTLLFKVLAARAGFQTMWVIR